MEFDSELEGFRSDRYLARSWALLTRDRGWIKVVLLMTISLLVPIAGWLGVMGYVLEWARHTAWGATNGPKQKGVKLGECFSTGWRAFVVMLVWYFCFAVIAAILDVVPVLSGLLTFLWSIVMIGMHVVVGVAVLRATIYQKIAPGLRVETIWKMVRHDPRGLLRVLGMLVALGLIAGAVLAVLFTVMLTSIVPQLMYAVSYLYDYGYYMSDYMVTQYVFNTIFAILGSLGPSLLVAAVISTFAASMVSLLGYTALALWMRQFNVPAWGRDEDPLPPFLSDPRDQGFSTPQNPVSAPVTPADPFGTPGEKNNEPVQGEKNDAPVQGEKNDAPEPIVADAEVAEPVVAESEEVAAPEPVTQAEPEPAPGTEVETESEPASEIVVEADIEVVTTEAPSVDDPVAEEAAEPEEAPEPTEPEEPAAPSPKTPDDPMTPPDFSTAWK